MIEEEEIEKPLPNIAFINDDSDPEDNTNILTFGARLFKLFNDTRIDTLNNILRLTCQNPRYLPFARWCMKLGAHPNRQSQEGQSPLHLATISNNVEFIKECIRLKDNVLLYLNEPNKQGQLLAQLALAYNPTREIFNLLMAEGNNGRQRTYFSLFNPSVSQRQNRTPFHTAVLISDLTEVKRHILQNTADNSTEKVSGQTVLHTAAMIGNVEVLSALLEVEAIANVNQAIRKGGRKGMTPLWIAASYGHLEVVKRLVEHGANIHQPSRNGQTPISVAYEQQFFDVVTFLREKGAELPTDIQRPVNRAQSTHTDTVHETAAQTALNLQEYYADSDKNQALREFEEWIEILDTEDEKNRAAINAFHYIKSKNFVEPISNMTFQQLLALTWLGINDKSQVIASMPNIQNDTQKQASQIVDRRKTLIQYLYETQRGNNLDEQGNDAGGSDDIICESGIFNKLIQTLHGAHEKVSIIIVNNDTILCKAMNLCKEQFLALPDMQQKILAGAWTKEEGLSQNLWHEIRKQVIDNLQQSFRNLVKNPRLQALIDVKVERFITNILEHAIPYMPPPENVLALQLEKSAQKTYLPASHSIHKRKKTEAQSGTSIPPKKLRENNPKRHKT